MSQDHLLSTLLTVHLLGAGNQHFQPVHTTQEAAGALQRVFEEFVNESKSNSSLAVKGGCTKNIGLDCSLNW